MPFEQLFLPACPACGEHTVYIIESKKAQNGQRRRKQCNKCKHRFTTFEIDELEYKQLMRSVALLRKVSKVLGASSVPAPSNRCTDCMHATDRGCSFEFPEFGTSDADDCMHFSHTK